MIAAGFWGNRYAISCSQDHNVKVWDCSGIPERQPPKGSKINKKRRKKMEVEVEKGDSANKAKEQESSSDE